jgi:phenylacetate-CoA ligase
MGGPSLARRLATSVSLAREERLQRRFPFAPPGAIEAAQRRRLRGAIAHAWEHVPYYRETMRRLGLAPSDISTASDLRKLPLIDRDELQRDPEYFLSRSQPREAYAGLHTGGTTGEPITVFWDRSAIMRSPAYGQRSRSVRRSLVPHRLRPRVAHIVSPLETARELRAAVGPGRLVPGRVRFNVLRLSMLDSPSANVPKLNAFRPDVIRSFGSYIEALFTYLSSTAVPFARPRVVVYGSDPLSDGVRRLIEEGFGIHVLSTYGAVETGEIGFECEQHSGYHLNVDLAPARVIDSEGRDLPPGENGEIVVSNLVNRGTVLLNYLPKDLAAALPGRCPCGRALPLLSFVQGRTDDWLEDSRGRPVHPQLFRAIVRTEPEILRYQLVQEARGRFRVGLVVAPGCERRDLEARVRERFRDEFGAPTEVRIEFVDSLPRTVAGKTRPVVSMVPTSRPDERERAGWPAARA